MREAVYLDLLLITQVAVAVAVPIRSEVMAVQAAVVIQDTLGLAVLERQIQVVVAAVPELAAQAAQVLSSFPMLQATTRRHLRLEAQPLRLLAGTASIPSRDQDQSLSNEYIRIFKWFAEDRINPSVLHSVRESGYPCRR